jgi:6-phosphogluconolactonase
VPDPDVGGGPRGGTERGAANGRPAAGDGTIRVEVVGAPNGLAVRAAEVLAATLDDAVARRGSATLAVSGGSTPGDALAALAAHELPWERIHLFQVDERLAPDGAADRNLELIRQRFLSRRALPPTNLHPMPVTAADPDAAAARYAAVLVELAGDPPVLDAVQLGLGADGHTASLVPGDAVIDVTDRDVAVTRVYEGRRRMTLTLPALARARQLVWLVRGADKAAAVARLVAGDRSIPAGRVPPDRSVLLVDPAAATGIGAAGSG